MVNRYAIIEDSTNRCINIILWDPSIDTWAAPTGCTAVQSDTANITMIVEEHILSDALIG